MRKTIVTALALCAAALAYGETVTYTTSTTGGSADMASYYGWSVNWGGSPALTVSATDGTTTTPTTSTLTQITLAATTGNFTGTAYLAVYDSSGNYLGISDDTATWASNTASVFSFNNASISLSSGQRYYFVFVSSEEDANQNLSSVSAVQFRSAVRTSAGGSTGDDTFVRVYSNATVSDSNGQYSTNVVATAEYVTTVTTADTTAAVPEPATATLSLLALAGLAARRRRK